VDKTVNYDRTVAGGMQVAQEVLSAIHRCFLETIFNTVITATTSAVTGGSRFSAMAMDVDK
jgi:hypothetical protein